MGTICILFGLVIFLCSLGTGFAAARWFLNSMYYRAFESLPSSGEIIVIVVGAFAFVGLLLCLNLVMHGLTYNKLCKLERRKKDKRSRRED